MGIDSLIEHNAERWQHMHLDHHLVGQLGRVSTRLCAPDAKARYEAVSFKTRVPWFIIAVIHEREASQSWRANLANGDPWNAVSHHVPRGQGPFHSWEDAAVNALSRTPPYASHWGDWTAGGALTLLEQYNGLGYYHHGIASPYVWASTDQYHRGKYIADGHFDPDAIDHQLGCAALIASMAHINNSVKFAETA